jgi:cytochrome c biogenesis protein CcmG, thiol:disulfide interchange protein DsbE
MLLPPARVCLAAALASCSASCATSHSASLPPSASLPSLDQPSAFSVPDERGDLTRVPDGAARATVVEFWATSCEPCGKALPALGGEATRLERDGIALVLLGVLEGGEPLDRARAALRAWGVERPFLVDRGGGVQRAMGIDGLPATVVLDARGVVRWAAPPSAPPGEIAAAARRVASMRP